LALETKGILITGLNLGLSESLLRFQLAVLKNLLDLKANL